MRNSRHAWSSSDRARELMLRFDAEDHLQHATSLRIRARKTAVLCNGDPRIIAVQLTARAPMPEAGDSGASMAGASDGPSPADPPRRIAQKRSRADGCHPRDASPQPVATERNLT
jgi:hypothetical protein